MNDRVIVGKDEDYYLVRFLYEGETIETPFGDDTFGQVINTDYKTISPITRIASIINMQPYFDWVLIDDEQEIERLYALAREKFIR